jgi:DNA-binding MarR family transcriptional regulator
VEHPSFCLKQAYLAMRKALDEALQPYGLTAAQFDVLQYLWMQDGMEHRELQERLGVSSPTLTNVIDSMVDRDLVERRISPQDARVKLIYLTPHARQLHEQLGTAGEHFAARMLQGFSRSEAGLFVEWLKKVTRNLDSIS